MLVFKIQIDLLDEFHQHAIVAGIALPGEALDLLGDLGRQRYTAANVLGAGFCARSSYHRHSSTGIHHCGACAHPRPEKHETWGTRLLSSEPWFVGHTKSTRSHGADAVI
jgi:hypothetical protein